MPIQKDIQASSIAEQIANDLNEKFNVDWITPFLVQLFIVLTFHVRNIIYAHLQLVRASLITKKAKFVREFQKGDELAKKLNDLRIATAIFTSKIDSILRIVPIDSTLTQIPEVDDFLKTLASDIPLRIPENIIFDTIGIGGFDLLEGVTDYTSLKNKIDEIEFRLTRATALSHYAQTGFAYIDNLIQKIDVYLDIIVTLNAQ